MRAWLPFLAYGLFVSSGFLLMESTWNRTAYVYIGETRSPAATRGLSDYFPVDARVIRRPMENQIFDPAFFAPLEGGLGLNLGHLILEDPSGRARFACQVESRSSIYNRMELSFSGVGVSEDGVSPAMTIDSPCRADHDPLRLTPILVPLSRIYETEPKARHLELPEIGGTAVRLENLASVWPERWALIRVRFYNSDDASTGLILKPLPAASRDGLSFQWKKR